jgi:hypothetical protein
MRANNQRAKLKTPTQRLGTKSYKTRSTSNLSGARILRGAVSILALTIAFVIGSEPYKPAIDPANFQSKVDNPYFPLVPGTTLKYQEKGGGQMSENEITVTSDTKEIMGVKCVVVHDVVMEKGTTKEDTYDWYAQDKQGSVWYFGEATKEFKAGGRVSHEGSWEAGVKGAQPGIIMPGEPKPGKAYRQEYSPNTAEDMGQVVATNETVTVPAGTFNGCVKTKDWSLLESGNEYKWYAKGVGVVRTETTAREIGVLMSIKRP